MALHAERILARTFFDRLFENETLPAVPQAQLVIWSLVGLATPGLMMAVRVGRMYVGAAQSSRAALFDAILRDQVIYVTYSMAALGFVALLMWEGVFPDRRDARMLGVLPLPTRTHVIGRLAGVAAFAALFSIGINLLAGVGYGAVLFLFDAASGPVRNTLAHIIATATAGWFAFFVFILTQGLLLNVFGRTIARRLALVLQLIFIMVVLQALMFAPLLAVAMRDTFQGSVPVGAARWLPPAWFVAGYDVLAATRRPTQSALAASAAIATLAVVTLATALIASSYGRLVRIAVETLESGESRRSTVYRRISDRLASILQTGAVQRAIAGFTLRTVVRSRAHVTLLFAYGGVGLALVVATLLPHLAKGSGSLGTPSVVLLAVPLVLYFFVLLGLRALFGMPTEIKANWVFRLALPDDHIPSVIAGVRLALLLAVVAPVATAAGGLATALWGSRTGVIHLGVTAAFGILLSDIVLIGLRKIPFACTYAPGRSRTPTLWPLYLVLFVVYAYGLAAVEHAAIARERWLLLLFGSVAGVSAGLAWLRQRHLRRSLGLVYEEEELDQMFEGFKLSEGLAAERPRT